ncbi:MAG TPA: glycosyltransferase family 4 protein [Clostridia bacterium]|nr:glycosyltransferase family 4 protein [Clostridia bacterium]
MKRVLIVASVASMIEQFNMPNIKILQNMGCEVHVAANFKFGNTISAERISEFKKELAENNVVYYNVEFSRNILNLRSNYRAYKKLKKIIFDNRYKFVHCHSPIGGVLTRLVAKKIRGKGTKVIYTAHGFHFFKGAPLINWLLYYPIEKWLSKYTDCLITINDEDYELAVNKLKARSVKKVPGVGVDLNKFVPQTLEKKKELRKQYGYSDDDFILIYVAEMSYRKHQDLLIKVVDILKNKIPNVKLLLVGDGKLIEEYKQQVKNLKLENYVHFLGYRRDVPNLMTLADIAVSASRQEGLPVNVMEAMATGLPLVVTDCRGNRDLVVNGENGFVVALDDVDGFAGAIEKLYNLEELRTKFGRANLEMIKKYSLENVMRYMEEIYRDYI